MRSPFVFPAPVFDDETAPSRPSLPFIEMVEIDRAEDWSEQQSNYFGLKHRRDCIRQASASGKSDIPKQIEGLVDNQSSRKKGSCKERKIHNHVFIAYQSACTAYTGRS